MKKYSEYQRIIKISDLLHEASSEIQILRNISWSDKTRQEFFKNNAQVLPSVEYAPFDAEPTLARTKLIREMLTNNDHIDLWAAGIAYKIESSARLLNTRGTPEFLTHSSDLYGKPSGLLQNGTSSILDLAEHFDDLFHDVKNIDLGAPPEPKISAETMVKNMTIAAKDIFGDLAPEVVLDENLSANALAGRRRIAFRTGATFGDNDLDQLIHHEAHVHVATSLNGYLQPHLKILGEAHPGSTTTQEGLAVFAEFITGFIDLDRLMRLSDRVIAIKMAVDGADFIEVYRYYLEKTDNPEQSFQNTKRVFRGGVISGGAPFTKDIVYLVGLINVNNFLRVAVTEGKFEYLDLLFAGKLDIADLPALKQMSDMGLVSKPKFLPPWMKDKRYLLSHLSFSSFLNTIKLSDSKSYYQHIFDS